MFWQFHSVYTTLFQVQLCGIYTRVTAVFELHPVTKPRQKFRRNYWRVKNFFPFNYVVLVISVRLKYSLSFLFFLSNIAVNNSEQSCKIFALIRMKIIVVVLNLWYFYIHKCFISSKNFVCTDFFTTHIRLQHLSYMYIVGAFGVPVHLIPCTFYIVNTAKTTP